MVIRRFAFVKESEGTDTDNSSKSEERQGLGRHSHIFSMAWGKEKVGRKRRKKKKKEKKDNEPRTAGLILLERELAVHHRSAYHMREGYKTWSEGPGLVPYCMTTGIKVQGYKISIMSRPRSGT